MTSVTDLWRLIDPDARLLAGEEALGRPVRGVTRTRSVAPHLPAAADGFALIADAALLPGSSADDLLRAVAEADLDLAALVIGGHAGPVPEIDGARLPVLASGRPVAALVGDATAYLADERAVLERLGTAMRLACAEAALADPVPAAAAGLISARLRRGVAVVADGHLATLHARRAGQALAARFAALQRRLPAGEPGPTDRSPVRRRIGGLWLLQGHVRPGATVWLFDDLPMSLLDEVGAESLSITLRALLRRPGEPRRGAGPVRNGGPLSQELPRRGRIDATLLAVARANGRVAPAARALGVHRNTVLYRLRRATSELGIDPRRPEDALRILREMRDAGGDP